MILLLTNKRDITTDFVVLELGRRGISFLRLNTEDITRYTTEFTVKSGWSFDVDGVQLQLNAVTGAYYRRPGMPEISDSAVPKATADYICAEWSAVLRSIWNALDGRFLNSPFAIIRAEDKPRQLILARSLGLQVPSLLITNDIGPAATFTGRYACIGKPLRHALVEDDGGGSVLFTQRLGELQESDSEAVAAAPVLFQQEITKLRDIRATVIGDRVFAAAIASQQHRETEVDWRKGSRTDIAHSVMELPADIQGALIELTKKLGLRFGAADLIEDLDGNFWFLEINPNGQWAWIERRTGLPLTAAIVDLLCSLGSD